MKLRWKTTSRGLTLLELLTVVFIISTLATIMIPTVKRAMYKAQLTGCMTNVRNMATALQIYSVDYDSHYPSQLNMLLPKYLKSVPACPSADIDTYTTGYTISADNQNFTLACKGNYHIVLGLGVDEPYYDLHTGLNPR